MACNFNRIVTAVLRHRSRPLSHLYDELPPPTPPTANLVTHPCTIRDGATCLDSTTAPADRFSRSHETLVLSESVAGAMASTATSLGGKCHRWNAGALAAEGAYAGL